MRIYFMYVNSFSSLTSCGFVFTSPAWMRKVAQFMSMAMNISLANSTVANALQQVGNSSWYLLIVYFPLLLLVFTPHTIITMYVLNRTPNMLLEPKACLNESFNKTTTSYIPLYSNDYRYSFFINIKRVYIPPCMVAERNDHEKWMNAMIDVL